MNIFTQVQRCTQLGLLLLLMASWGPAEAQKPGQGAVKKEHQARIGKVFINVTGDPKLAHRLWTYMDFELEDAGITVTTTESDADAIISGDISRKNSDHRLGVGVVRMEVTAEGQMEKIDECESTNSAEDGEVFNGAAIGIAKRIREKYPRAQTVKLDPASNMEVSDTFRTELPAWLNKSGFTLVDNKPADLILRVDLVREKVPIVENEMDYEVAAASRDGSVLLERSGGWVLSARLAGAPPELCAANVESLQWLYQDDGVYSLARQLAKTIAKHNETAASPADVITK